MTKVGLFGGSFNPPHLGHLIAVEEVLSALNLDKILFIPTCMPPHKEADLSAEERYKMTGIAISGNPRFEISDIEMKRGGISYTADTLRELRDLFREVEFYLIMGADEFSEIENWREPEAVLTLSKVVVMGRPGCELGEVGKIYVGRFLKVDVPLIEISSSDIRVRVKEGRSIAYLVPPGVEEYIIEKGFYR